MRAAAAAFLCLGLLGYPVGTARGQSLYGPGGLFLLPTANVPPKGQATLGILWLPQINPPTPNEHRHQTWISTSVDYGLTRDLEIGVERLTVTDWPATYGGFAKYRFLRETPSRPAMALGFVITAFGQNHHPPIGNIHTRTAFVALRKGFFENSKYPLVGHLGVEYINVSEGVVHNTVVPYGGVEIALARRVALIAEGRPRERGDTATPLALSLAYAYGHGGRLAVSWANTGQSERPIFGIGVGIAIGERR